MFTRIEGCYSMQGWARFAEIQPLASKIMQQSILKNRLSHAYLVQGERGTGKKQFAKLLTMTLFCENRQDVEPCFTCSSCKRIDSINHPDVHWIEPDGASIKNEQIDYLRKEFAYSGVESSRKVYIIDHIDTLTTQAANRLLKFLEEPDMASTAILLTNNSQAVLPTIRSRCQIIDLQPLDEVHFQTKLLEMAIENMTKDKSRLLSAVTQNIDEALRLHEEGKIYEAKQLVSELFDILMHRYEERFLAVHEQWLELLSNREEHQLGLEMLMLALRDLIRYQADREKNLYFFTKDEALIEKAVVHFSNKQLVNMLRLVLEAKQKLVQYVNPTLVIEQLILQF